jgi:Xaa-Pro aminopeptidase
MENDRPFIKDEEFFTLVRKTQDLMKKEDIDIFLAYGNEAEPQFARYYCDYWPSFEGCGVLITQTGDPVLLIGPESMTFAEDRSRIKTIKRMQAFRESSNPEYPGHVMDTLDEIVEDLGVRNAKKAAIAGINIIPQFTFAELSKALSKFPGLYIESGDDFVVSLRTIKSPDEIACLRQAGKITAGAMDYVIENIKPGMTELQVRGLALSGMYELGAENEAYPNWILAGDGGNQAISRARHKVIHKNELVHLQIGARYEGYASTIGRPIVIGKPEPWMTDAVSAGFEAYDAVLEQLRAGNNAGNVAKARAEIMKKRGYYDWLLYGPCHGTGLMEGEPPWIEDGSDYELKENMCFCICHFMGSKNGAGFRLEDSVRVAAEKAENMTNYRKGLIVL